MFLCSFSFCAAETAPSPLLVLEGRKKRRTSTEPPAVASAAIPSFIPVGAAVKQHLSALGGAKERSQDEDNAPAAPKKSKKSKKHKKKHKKRRRSQQSDKTGEDDDQQQQQQDLIIPISPGLAIDPPPDDQDLVVKRSRKESVDCAGTSSVRSHRTHC